MGSLRLYQSAVLETRLFEYLIAVPGRKIFGQERSCLDAVEGYKFRQWQADKTRSL